MELYGSSSLLNPMCRGRKLPQQFRKRENRPQGLDLRQLLRQVVNDFAEVGPDLSRLKSALAQSPLGLANRSARYRRMRELNYVPRFFHFTETQGSRGTKPCSGFRRGYISQCLCFTLIPPVVGLEHEFISAPLNHHAIRQPNLPG